jgi:hypothetical protein
MVDFVAELITSKYHFSIAKRMYGSYSSFPEKRFIIGVITELAKSSSKIIRAYLSYFNKKTIEDFNNLISGKYLNREIALSLLKVLEIEKAQKTTPVQFNKEDKIIMLVNGKYKILTVKRLGELIEFVKKAIDLFTKLSRQV